MLKKKHSFGPVGGAKTGTQGEDELKLGYGWKTGVGKARLADRVVPYLHVDKQLGSETDHAIQGFSSGKSNLKTSD